MTAHAMKGYEQRCLDAGMDGYVAKPAARHQLEGAIARIPVKANAGGKSWNCATANTWNPEHARARIGDDDALLCEIIDLFLEENPKQLSALKQALSEADAASVERIAHALKGELGCLQAIEAGRHARELEEQARDGRLEGAARLLQLLENEISAAAKAMRNFRDAARGSGPPIALKASQS
jgi:HPt (histidine-containing phosphotransfer) domain-containing protein